MAKTLYLTSVFASAHLGTQNLSLAGVASTWWGRALSESHGTDTTGTAVTATVPTVLGPTNGLELQTFGSPLEWLTEPLSAGFTISGTITLNLWAAESSTSANVAINAVIEKVDRITGALTQIAKTARTTEVPLTTPTVANFTVTPTSTVCSRGDRLRVRVFADDAGTMNSALTATFWYDRSTAAQGESFLTFTENLTFESTSDPTGSTYYLTDTASSINPGSAIEKVASKLQGGGSVNSVTSTVTGPTAGVQLTDSAGGTAIEWYTLPLTAVTLGGKAKFNVHALEDANAANVSIKAEVAITATDGSSAVVWAAADIANSSTFGEVALTDGAVVAWPAGADTAITSGQRLRFRLYVDDTSQTTLTAGHTATVSYNGASVGAAGDTYVILPVTVIEQTTAAVIPDVGMALTVT